MKYSRSAITQLTRWYKQILIKCAILNAAILVGSFGNPAVADASEINQTGVPYATATSIQHSGNVFNISTTTTNGKGDVGLNTFGKFNVSEGDVANLNLINQQDKLVNLVFDSSASHIDGADKNILGMSGKSSDWQNILNGSAVYLFTDIALAERLKKELGQMKSGYVPCSNMESWRYSDDPKDTGRFWINAIQKETENSKNSFLQQLNKIGDRDYPA